MSSSHVYLDTHGGASSSTVGKAANRLVRMKMLASQQYKQQSAKEKKAVKVAGKLFSFRSVLAIRTRNCVFCTLFCKKNRILHIIHCNLRVVNF